MTILLIGQILLTICGIPAAYDALRSKNVNYSQSFLWLWLLGDILSFIGAFCYEPNLTTQAKVGLLLNYSINIVSILIVMKFNKRKTP